MEECTLVVNTDVFGGDVTGGDGTEGGREKGRENEFGIKK